MTPRHPGSQSRRPPKRTIALHLALSAAIGIVVASCAQAQGPSWTYLPITQVQSVAPSAASSAELSSAPSAGAPSPEVSPSGSGGSGVAIDIETTAANPLAFAPSDFTVPAGAQVTVTYTNDTNLPHNIDFFDGKDQNASSLGKTRVMTGPQATDSVTFTAPSQPGDYFFWCDVHQLAMTGTYRVK